MPNQYQLTNIQKKIQHHNQIQQSIRILGSGSKSFLYPEIDTDSTIEVGDYQGIINYQPSELCITAKAGTTIKEIEQILTEKKQMLAFEPPVYEDSSTIGGAVSTGISGSSRPFRGALRDYLLGCQLINGKGELLKFGGEVMKNVAGYDVSRMMVGSYGTLGLLTELSFKLLPKPEAIQTIGVKLEAINFSQTINSLIKQSYPLSAACYYKNKAYLRFSGIADSIEKYSNSLFQDYDSEMIDNRFWADLNNQTLDFFNDNRNLWRINSPLDKIYDLSVLKDQSPSCLYDWAGSLLWLYTDDSSTTVRDEAKRIGGSSQLFRLSRPETESSLRQHPLSESMLILHKKIKNSFDPHGILNPALFYPDL